LPTRWSKQRQKLVVNRKHAQNAHWAIADSILSRTEVKHQRFRISLFLQGEVLQDTCNHFSKEYHIQLEVNQLTDSAFGIANSKKETTTLTSLQSNE